MSIKSFTAYTNEIDDVDAAVSELLGQLDLDGENRLRKHTIGIVSCYAEYLESGVWAALCEKLPFEAVGATTIASMCAGQLGETMLCLMVLTSDELRFSTGLSESVAGEDAATLNDMYARALDKLPGKPSLMLSFTPLLNNFSSDFYVDSMTQVSGGVPDFGTLAVDHNPDYHGSRVLLNGENYVDRVAILLIHGPLEPVFYVGAVSGDKVFTDRSVVTDSEKNRLKMVDGVPVIDYLQSLGLTRNDDGTVTGINSFPVIVDYNDGTTPVARAMFAVTPEGYAVCGGNIPAGATISLGSFDENEIVATSRRTLAGALESGRHGALLMYSCIGRYFAQGYNATAEFQSLLDSLKDADARADAGRINYMAAYSGGELCPVYGKNKDAGSTNRNHNNSFIICGL